MLNGPEHPHDAVHDARKCFKKIRAALRLARGPLDDVYSEENACFRDLGRELSRLRDAEAMIETIDRLAETFQSQARPALFQTARGELVSRRDTVAKQQIDLTQKLHDVSETLDRARRRMDEWPEVPGDFSAFAPGLAKTYRRGVEGMETAFDEPADENFHEWRKRVKYLWYHVRLLQNTWPKVMRALRSSLKTLARTLGHDHDLAVLCQRIRHSPEAFGSETDVETLLALAARHQKDLRTEAEPLGMHIYAERVSDFVDRIEAYWQAWHAAD
ncbi:MAG: CHAD domain-containing protein [Planctomycetes bacterium]|jgi:CHAD domain-containing protein|nr:CHAD domain-containing protein [Planctomycetota bacterium]